VLIINCESAIIPRRLSAHKALTDQGILHRDISAGNVLLSMTQDGPLRGFITDLEFARIASSTISKPRVTTTSTIGPQNRYNDRGRLLSTTQPTTRTHTTFETTVTVERGAGMTVNYFDKESFFPH
jgi:serine/threonine protein kinase